MASPPVPPKPVPGGIAGPGLVAFVVVSKFADHLPLYRLEDILTRHGVHLARSTLCDWVRNAAVLLEPLAELQKARVLLSPIIWTDDTPVTVLGGEEPGSSTGRFWAYIGDDEHPYSVYDFTMSRTRDGPAEFLKDFRGFLQADAYGGYDGIYLDSEGRIVEVACWAHARRKFYDARSNAPREANRDPGVDPPALRHRGSGARTSRPRRVRRCASGRRCRSSIGSRAYLDELTERMLPKSALGKAVTYARNQWAALRRYTSDGRLTIDNNVSERTLRLQAIGRKELDVPGECRGGPASGGAVHDPGGCQAASPGAVGLSSRRGAEAERRRDGPGVVAAGPLGREPPGACAAASPGRVAAEGDPPEGSTAGASCDRRAEGVRTTDAEVGKGSGIGWRGGPLRVRSVGRRDW